MDAAGASHRPPAAGMMAEKFIPDHVLIYLSAGRLQCYDATKSHTFGTGECFLARKNRLAKYKVESAGEALNPIAFCFDEPFLRAFAAKHPQHSRLAAPKDTFIPVATTALLSSFMQSIVPYCTGPYQMDKDFEDVKYEELLLILLKQQPQLAGLLFDFGIPEKIDLEAFMEQNFSFNVSLGRFAFLTGRSISAFKRDFATTFQTTPGLWLVRRRLEEAYFLIDQKSQKPSDIYLDLGFESLSHFSVAFKKQFGRTPTDLQGGKNMVTSAGIL